MIAVASESRMERGPASLEGLDGRWHTAAMLFRRRVLLLGRPILRRPRLLGMALVGGVGYALGRSNRPGAPGPLPGAAPSPASPDEVGRLHQPADLHASGAVTDEEFAAAKRRLLES